jgi:hypothetical protein
MKLALIAVKAKTHTLKKKPISLCKNLYIKYNPRPVSRITGNLIVRGETWKK